MKCPIEVNRSFGSAFAISAILANFVSISSPPQCVVNVSLPRSIPCRLPFLHPHYTGFIGTTRRSDSLTAIWHPYVLTLVCHTPTAVPNEYLACRRASGSPELLSRHWYACLALRPRGSSSRLACFVCRCVVFRVVKPVDLPIILNFEAQSLSGLHPGCLRLNDIVTTVAPRLAIGGVAFAFPSRVPTC